MRLRDTCRLLALEAAIPKSKFLARCYQNQNWSVFCVDEFQLHDILKLSNFDQRTAAGMKVRTFSQFDDLPGSYQDLFQTWGSQCYCYALPWFKNFVKCALEEGDRVRIYGVEMEDAAVTPVLALTTRYKVQTPKLARPRRLSALANYYTTSFGPVYRGTEKEISRAVRELARAIHCDAPDWDVIDLRPLDVDSPLFQELVQAFRSESMIVQPYFCFGNWYLPVRGQTYQRYFETLPSVLRNTIKRKSKKLERLGNARIEIVTDLEGVEAAIEEYEKVYQASWKVPEPYPSFTPGLIRVCAEQGWLRLGLVHVGDQPVAAQLWIVNGGRATIYKLSHDERFAELSAGSILTARLMERVLDVDKVEELDFGNGDDPYKKTWLPCRRERWGILALNPRTLRGQIGILRHVGGRMAGRVLRSLLRRPQKNPWASSAMQIGAASEIKTDTRSGTAQSSGVAE